MIEETQLYIHTLSPGVFRMLLNLVMVTDPWPLNESENTTFIDWMNHESQLWGYPSWVEAYHQFKVSDVITAEMFNDSRLFRASLIDVPADKAVSQADVTTAIANLLVSVGHGDVVAVEAYLDLSARLVMRWIHTRIERGRNVVSQIEAFEDARSSDESPVVIHGTHNQPPMPEGMKLICIRCNKTPAELDEYAGPAKDAGMTPDEYVWDEEGTLNRENGHFLCTTDYVAAGMPSSSAGWTAP